MITFDFLKFEWEKMMFSIRGQGPVHFVAMFEDLSHIPMWVKNNKPVFTNILWYQDFIEAFEE